MRAAFAPPGGRAFGRGRQKAGDMKTLIETIARGLVDNPERVQVSEVEDDARLLLQLRVAQEDLGKVIGKNGRTARAMRTLLAAASIKSSKRVELEIVE